MPSDDQPTVRTADEVAAAMLAASEQQETPPSQESPAETPPETTEPSAEETAAQPAESGQTEPAAEGGEADVFNQALSNISQYAGSNWDKKYKSFDQWVMGMRNLERRIGERDADAEFGRQVRQYEREFQDFLQSRQAPQPARQGQPQPTSDLPPYEQFQQWVDEVEREGDQASPEARRQVARINRELVRRLYQQQQNPQAMLEQLQGYIAPLVQQSTQQVAGDIRRNQSQQQMVDQFREQHKSWLFVGGQPGVENFTPDGYRLSQYGNELMAQGIPIGNALQMAYDRLYRERSEQQRQQEAAAIKPKPVKPAAQHQPAVAAPAGGDPEETYREDLRKFANQPDGLAQHLMKLSAAGQLR